MKIKVFGLVGLTLAYTQAQNYNNNNNHAKRLEELYKLASVEAPAIPTTHNEPGFEYNAVKFLNLTEGIIKQYEDSTGWQFVGALGSLSDYRLFKRKAGMALRKRHAGYSAELGALEEIAVETASKRGKLYKRRAIADSWVDTKDFAILDPLYPQQWHLVNNEDVGKDINVTGAWRQGVIGTGVTVALIDDGLDYTSEDLLENFSFAGSYDFNDKTKLPTPRLIDDYHGTRCAGQIAAVRNKVCGIGVAHGAKVSGIRMLSGEIGDQEELNALNYEMHTNAIYSCSWGPNDDGRTVQGPNRIVEEAFHNGVLKGRHGRGSVYVFATGNGGAAGDNCNFDGYTNSIYTISIGAIDHKDVHPYYSEMCSAQLAVTYSNGDNHGIVTTDLGLRSCTSKHGGTSAAAPLAAGIFALAISVNQDLTWRDVQHLTVRTAVPVDTGDSDWETVAKGRKYNHKYGFGKLDAGLIVAEAKRFTHVGKQTKIIAKKDSAHATITPTKRRDSPGKEVARTVQITQADKEKAKMKSIEHVTVRLNIDHEYRGNIEVELESPGGIRSQLAAVRKRDDSKQGLNDWRFMSVKHWDEDPVGNWTLHVRNVHLPDYSGTLIDWQLTLFGESTEPLDELEPTPAEHEMPIESAFPSLDSKLPADEMREGQKGTSSEVHENENENEHGHGKVVAFGSVAGFFAGALVSTLVVLLVVRRRERKLARQWAPVGDTEAYADRNEFYAEHADNVFEFAELSSATPAPHTPTEIAKGFRDSIESTDGDDRTTAQPESSESSGKNSNSDENQRLV